MWGRWPSNHSNEVPERACPKALANQHPRHSEVDDLDRKQHVGISEWRIWSMKTLQFSESSIVAQKRMMLLSSELSTRHRHIFVVIAWHYHVPVTLFRLKSEGQHEPIIQTCCLWSLMKTATIRGL